MLTGILQDWHRWEIWSRVTMNLIMLPLIFNFMFIWPQSHSWHWYHNMAIKINHIWGVNVILLLILYVTMYLCTQGSSASFKRPLLGTSGRWNRCCVIIIVVLDFGLGYKKPPGFWYTCIYKCAELHKMDENPGEAIFPTCSKPVAFSSNPPRVSGGNLEEFI